MGQKVKVKLWQYYKLTNHVIILVDINRACEKSLIQKWIDNGNSNILQKSYQMTAHDYR